MTGFPLPPSGPTTARPAGAPPPLPAPLAGPAAVPMEANRPPAGTPSFSTIGVLLAALEHPGAPTPPGLPAPDSPAAREVQTLLTRRLAAVTDDAGLQRPADLMLAVEDDGQVKVRTADRAVLERLQPLVDIRSDLQALARLLHAIRATTSPEPTGLVEESLPRRIEAAGPAGEAQLAPRWRWWASKPVGPAAPGIPLWLWGAAALALVLAWYVAG